jgi:hypothetical protein
MARFRFRGSMNPDIVYLDPRELQALRETGSISENLLGESVFKLNRSASFNDLLNLLHNIIPEYIVQVRLT